VPQRDVAIRKILLLRFSSLGDIVMTTAMIRAVRKQFPACRIDMVVREDFLDLIRENPHLDRKIGLARKAGLRGLVKLAKELRRERYDFIYDAHGSLRTRFLLPLLGPGLKFRFPKYYLRRSIALTFKKRHLLTKTRFLEKFCEPLARVGVKYDGGGPEVIVPPAAKKTALEKCPVPRAELVGIIPSAQWPGKRWPLDRFRKVIDSLMDTSAFHFIVFGGKEDTFCEELCSGLPASRVTNAQGKLTLAESMALVGECDFVIANDTGLMHVADALGKPSVLILGPTSGDLGCLPFHPQSKIMEHDLWCRPCSKNGQAPCIRKQRFCLDMTTVQDVSRAALNVGWRR